METRRITSSELSRILDLNEDHFNEVKSFRISPAKLQETFVAFANTDGGQIFVGVEDKRHQGQRVAGFPCPEDAAGLLDTLLRQTTPAVDYVDVEFLDTGDLGYIVHIFVPKSTEVHFTAKKECFVRLGASNKKIHGQEIVRLAYSKGSLSYEQTAVETVEVDEIVQSAVLADYMKRVGTQLAPFDFLRKQRLFAKSGDRLHPNACSVLMFDEEPQAALNTRCAIKVYRLRTTETDYRREQLAERPTTITGPIERSIKEALAKVQELLTGAKFHHRGKVVELRYPVEAIQEIVVNAVIHRDYSIHDDIHIRVFDDRIEVISPGRLPGYITLQNIYDERYSRNPNLVRLLHNLPNPLNHDIGEGLNTARNKLREVGLVPPEFEERENSFVVTIRHQRLASIEEVILDYFDQNPEATLTNRRVRELSGEDDINKVKKAFQKLRQQGEIEPVDPTAKPFDFAYKRASKKP